MTEPAPASEVVTFGETMVLLVAEQQHSLLDSETLRIHCAGAESNVALYLADLGHRVTWMSRLGDDQFGDRIIGHLAGAGVCVDPVIRDPDRPTGLFVKEQTAAPDGDTTRVRYYRTGSAASHLSPTDLAAVRLDQACIVHVSGVTPALSRSAEAATRHLLRNSPQHVIRSFDVNYRGSLWPVQRASSTLRDLAVLADIVFVGRDEAEHLWGTPNAASIRRHLGSGHDLIVKDADIGATLFLRGSGDPVFVPAREVEVVEPVGAGDAFAAGYLSALLRDEPPSERLAFAHRVAALALGSAADHVDARALRHLADEHPSQPRDPYDEDGESR